MKVLIHDERPDIPDFLLEVIKNRGHKAGFAKDSDEILSMLTNHQYDIILANGGYGKIGPEQQRELISSSVFVIDISNSHKEDKNTSVKADLYLQRPFLITELWQAIGQRMHA